MSYCKDCGQPCRVVVIDQGIGYFEYGGATGYDEDKVEVSNCHEAEVLEEPEEEEEEDDPWIDLGDPVA